MSGYLWKYYLEDDVDRFRQLLETANYTTRAGGQKNFGYGHGATIGSPESFGTSPTLVVKSRKQLAASALTLSRADINHKDNVGLTILHHAASSTSDNAIGFATALLDHPLTDLYVQDSENGWTALHRAFYFGNVSIARLIIERDRKDMLLPTSGGSNQYAGGLVKIKDNEGNGPFDLYEMTIQDRSLHMEENQERGSEDKDLEDTNSQPGMADDDDYIRRDVVAPMIALGGDAVFTFGSNKNVTLGFGDEDDRQYPERVTLRRPDHLLHRFHREHVERKNKEWASMNFSGGDWSHQAPIPAVPVLDLPTIIRVTPLVIQNVFMSKLSTAVLTADPESNLYMCGHGPGGRLGTGDERTRYNFVCIEGGALAGKKMISVALGQNHTLAVSSRGEVFSWGSNGFGQLGYSLPRANVKDEEPIQNSPRQMFGPLKREVIIGVAASRIHSVAHTTTSLYTFGKNEGQLGIIDSDARSLDIQTTPRRIAAALFSCPILSVSAIEKATICLLENRDVWVFANYGYSKVAFPLDGFANYFLKSSFLATKYETSPNCISKICAGGDTICAMSTSGEVFTIAVSKRVESEKDTTSSTTNPSKIRGALSQPYCVWSAKKRHMAARDVDVDQDGSIILASHAGSVWRRVKRAKIKDATAAGTGDYKPKDYKFSRIPGLTRVIGVRASSYGAYAAIRHDCDVTREQIQVSTPSLWADVQKLLVFEEMISRESIKDRESSGADDPPVSVLPGSFIRKVVASEDLEKDVESVVRLALADSSNSFDAEIRTSTSSVSIPVHQFILAARSSVFRRALSELSEVGLYTLAETLSIEESDDGKVIITVQGLDFLTIFCLVLYCYTDSIVSFWQFARHAPKLAHRYRQIRIELMKLASRLEMRQLETAVRQMVTPKKTMNHDLELAVASSSFFAGGDIVVQLEDDEEIRVHSTLLCQRCPFFEGLFMGRAGGLWLASRREASDDPSDAITVDLKHVSADIFRLVLRHIYADAGEEIFDQASSDDLNDHFALEELIDLVMDVMGVANELMLNRLSQICQKVVGRYVNIRNVCHLLNAVAPCSVTEFKDAALEYICLNLEAIVQNGILDELDEDLQFELDQIIRENQLACLPIARSGRAEGLLFERHPELAEKIDRNRRAKVDSILMSNKFAETEGRASTSFRAQSLEEVSASPIHQKNRRRSRGSKTEEMDSSETTPVLKAKKSSELLFDMSDEAEDLDETDSSPSRRSGRDSSNGVVLPSPMINITPVKTSSSSGLFPLSDEVSPSPARIPSRPWGAAPLPTDKLDLKHIMAQTSSDRQSGISIALSEESKKEPRPAGSFTTKLSQKERKRLQQQQSTSGMDPAGPSNSSILAPGSSPVSPWLNPSSGKHPFSMEESPSPLKPQLTMRQTLANKGPASKQKAAEPSIAFLLSCAHHTTAECLHRLLSRRPATAGSATAGSATAGSATAATSLRRPATNAVLVKRAGSCDPAIHPAHAFPAAVGASDLARCWGNVAAGDPVTAAGGEGYHP